MTLPVWVNNRPVTAKVYQWGPVPFGGTIGSIFQTINIPHTATFNTSDMISMRGMFFVESVNGTIQVAGTIGQTVKYPNLQGDPGITWIDSNTGGGVDVVVNFATITNNTFPITVICNANGGTLDYNVSGHLVLEVTS